jgi:catechol 2,3-dioxygenase-like lactoylglutathione lyase family enzyme
MIVYTMVGAADLPRTIRFYDPIFAELGLEPCWRDAQSTCWGVKADPRVPRFFVGRPFDGAAASVGNGAMTAFWADTTDQITRCHALALAGGGTCEGPPGSRPQYGATFFGAYVRDPDGNKIAFVRF